MITDWVVDMLDSLYYKLPFSFINSCMFFSQKILKNLYENTALHEKIAENINRGLSTQCKLGQVPGEGDGESSISLSTTKKGRECSGSSIGDGRERSCGPGEQASGTTGGGDVAFLKEFDHIVTGIISETTSDPVFESLIDEVFGKNIVLTCEATYELHI